MWRKENTDGKYGKEREINKQTHKLQRWITWRRKWKWNNWTKKIFKWQETNEMIGWHKHKAQRVFIEEILNFQNKIKKQ